MSAAVFLDKDGTLVRNVPYNVEPERVELAEGAGEALRALQEAGYRLAVVSNQSGVARGYFPEDALAGVERRIRELLATHAVRLDYFTYCPHLPAAAVARYAVACDCRKPQPGLLHRAAADVDVDVAASWMVGDILDDVEAGARAGCRTVLVDSGGETEWLRGPFRQPDFVVRDLRSAARVIIDADGAARAGGPRWAA